MITWRPFKCPACDEERYQRIVFIGGEFAYECPVCVALHCFTESLFHQFQDTWLHEPRWRRYVGTYHDGKFLDVEGRSILPGEPRFSDLCGKWRQYRDQGITRGGRVRIERRTDRDACGSYFVASALHEHFNEAFRGLLRAKEHLLDRHGATTFNILLAFDGGPLKGIVQESGSKLEGLDEIWWVPFHKEMRWPFAPRTPDFDAGTELNLELTELLGRRHGIAEVISKCPGPVRQGSGLVRTLLEPEQDLVIRSTAGIPLDGKYVAVLIHPDNHQRAGLWTADQVQEAVGIIADVGERPVLPIVDGQPAGRYEGIPGLVIVPLSDLREQAQFFRDHCKGVIGTNTSGCNLPALYGVPIFAFAKGRPFPDDFYCFARMSSKYDPDFEPWKGRLEKPDNVVELQIEAGAPTHPSSFSAEVRRWFKSHVAPTPDYRGRDELHCGFHARCPACRRVRRSRSFRLVGSDVCVELHCSDCDLHFVSYRGLTTASEITVFPAEGAGNHRFGERYLNMLELSKATEPSRRVERSTTWSQEGGDTVAFYCMKPSISDLYYTLPSLLQLREELPAARLAAVVPRQNEPLLPEGICDEIWRVDVDPYAFDTQDYSPVHAELESLLRGVGGITSNYPGTLPFGPNTYRHLRERLRPAPCPDVGYRDVVVLCRLSGARCWPDAESLARVRSRLDDAGLSVRPLAFPRIDRVPLPDWLRKTPELVVDPTFEEQLEYLGRCGVCVTPHGAGEVPAAIAAPAVVELETEPPHWKEDTPQPVRYGLPVERFTRLRAARLTDVSADSITDAVSRLLGGRTGVPAEAAAC